MRKLLFSLFVLGWPSAAMAGGGQVQSSLGAASSSFTLCTGPCQVYDVQAIATAADFVYVFDAATLPANGTVSPSVAKVAFPIASGAMASYTWPAGNPAVFLNGAIIACSSAVPPTFTATSTCEFFGRANN